MTRNGKTQLCCVLLGGLVSFVTATVLCRQVSAQEASAPSTQPAAPQPPLRLTDLPDNLVSRSDELAQGRDRLKSELTAARAAAEARFRRGVPNWDVLKSEESRNAIPKEASKAIRELQQIEVERAIVNPGSNPGEEKDPGQMYMPRENAMYYAGVLAALNDAEGAEILTAYYRLPREAVASVAEFLRADQAAQQEFLSNLTQQMEDKDLKLSQRAVDVALLIVRRQIACDPSVYAGLFDSAKKLASNPTHKASILRHEFVVRGKDSKNKVGQPVTIAGKLVGGADFSTESLKGKVILVDFWATWCGPCKAELPKIKAVYKKYHEQGLEIIGVSNDYAQQDLERYLKSDPDMPWPQLFDPKLAAIMQWHPISTSFGITSIPQMYLIDRKGMLRSITARKEYETLIPQLLAEQ